MANVRWPPWARIHADATLARRPDVARTEYDDGAVAQRRITTQGVYTRQVTVELGARMAEFDTWAAAHAHRYFLLRGPWDAVWRQVRVVGGAGGITYRQVGTPRSGPRWTAECGLEGPAVAYPGISIWDAGLALGDASHVYVRLLGGVWDVETPTGGNSVELGTLPDRSDATRRPAGALPAAWMMDRTVAYVQEGRLRKRVAAPVYTAILHLAATRSDSVSAPGPHVRPGALSGIACVWRYGDRTLVVRDWQAETRLPADEPYTIAPANSAELKAMLDALIAGAAPRPGDFALVWAGAGSVVDLDTLTTLGIGAAPQVA